MARVYAVAIIVLFLCPTTVVVAQDCNEPDPSEMILGGRFLELGATQGH